MESDQPTIDKSTSLSQTDLIVQRLISKGLPSKCLETKQLGLVQFVKENKMMLREVISALLPGIEDVQLPVSEEAKRAWHEYKEGCREGIRWAQWLMFEEEPEEKLREIQKETGRVRGVCGAVWVSNDIAYKCRTCENDPTCAICVPCFEAGNHVNHDYSMLHTRGGCCDCGDITAWKESGFCSEHRGPRQIPSLPKALLCSLEPVLEAILVEWARRLQSAEKVSDKKPKKWDDQAAEEKVATQTSAAMVAMLLNFCNCSESMLTFTGGLMTSDKVGLLDILLRSECFLPRKVVVKLHELLFKLLGDSNFKYQFAKAFIGYYPCFILDAMNEGIESAGGSRFKDNHHTFTNFSVQIFTVPTLTPRLVVELRLLDMLLETLKDVCISCAGEDGQLLVGKGLPGRSLYYRIIENIIEDIQFAMRHLEVARYVAQERPDISRAWLHLLAFTQGMDPQRRQTTIHVEEETDNWISASFIEMQMASIHPLFVDGAVKSDHVGWTEDKRSCQSEVSSKEELDDEIVTGRHVKIGRISWESDVFGNRRTNVGTTEMDTDGRGVAGEMLEQGSSSQDSPCTSAIPAARRKGVLVSSIPAALLWLMSECVSVLDTWLLLDASRETSKSKWPVVHKGSGVMQRRGMPYRARGGRGVTRDSSGLVSDERAGVGPEVVISAHDGTTRDALRFSRQTTPDLRRALDTIDERAGSRETGLLSGLFPQDAVHLQEVDIFASDLSLEGVMCESLESSKDNGKGSADWWMGSAMIDPGACLGFVWSDREWLDIDFDVSRQEISFHIPLHRFLTLALQKSLEVCATNLNVQQEAGKRSWHSDSQSIGGQCVLMQLFPPGYQVPSFVSFLMEHPLRLQVVCAQVRAGMWRRNGHSVQTLCEYYHSVKWCEKSSDLDLFLLQCCGVMAPPEEFVERILSRFGLADYFSSLLLRPNEFETSLAQQMLSFLIRIVAERSFCGLSAAQSSRRELVRRLAISDAPHSQLMKSLPPRLLEDKQWQEALQSISTYYKPSGMQQGRYSLREECWQELDLYHPRWSARELQSAEDRYLRARKVSAVINQLPKWQKPFPLLQSLSRIATCGKVHDILRSVFFHAAFSEKLSESRAPEGVLITALHLLALGLDACSLFAYEQDMIYKPTNMHSDFSSGLSAVSPTHDAHKPPPLLAKATEKVYMGGADGREVSSRQSLLSLLVILMQRHHTGEIHAVGLESHQCSIGDLIKRLLEKFANLHHECMYAIEYLAPEILHRVSINVSSKASDLIINEAPDVSEADKKRMLARERQAEIMAKMKAAQEKFAASIQSSHEGSDTEKIKSKNRDSDGKKRKESRSKNDNLDRNPISVSCALCRDSDSDSPTSFLTFVQRSRLLAIAEKGIPSWERKDTSGKAEASSLDKTVEVGAGSGDNGIHDPQTHFELWNLVQMALIGEMEEVETLFAILRDQGLEYNDPIDRQFSVGNTDVRMSETSSSETGSDDLIEEENNEFNNDSGNVILSDFNHCDKDSSSKEENEKKRESSIVTVLLEYVNILSRNHKEPQEIEKSSGLLGLPKKRPSPTSTVEGLLLDSLGSDDRVGVHMSSCGHAVHQECLDRYLSSLSQRYHSRTHFEGLQIVNPDQGEFLCPMCRRFANSVLPFFEGSSMYNYQNGQGAAGVSGLPSCSGLSAVASSRESFRIPKILQVPHAMYLLHNAEKLLWKSGVRKAVSKPLPKTLKAVFDYLFSRLCGLYFSDKENISKTNSRVSHGLLLWDVLRYTLMSAELAARIRKTGLSTKADNPLDVLWKEADISKGSILLLLLRAAKAIQNQNRQSVLLRARGMQLLVGSICFGVSKDSLSGPSMPGNISKVLQLLDNGKEAADIQFWRRTADPVLAHDPFSSLLWLVFCLPLSFPSSVEPFISLVHLLYLVCVTQTIAFMGESLMSDLQLSSSTKAFVQSVVTSLTGIYLYKAAEEENFIVPSGPVLIVMRRFTLAYLRRCALLQKLLFHVPSEVVLGEELKAEKMKPYEALTASKAFDRINNESRQAISDALEDLKELEDLEQRFSLPSLHAILEEESNREVVLRWCQHWSKEVGSRKNPFLPRPVTAAPFKLMELPTLYQTLLQRYIKERCLVCSTVPDEPALCLLCGTLCCAASRHPPCCCSTTRQSECYKHAMACGGGVGVYLMIRKTNVLLQRCARHASWQSPYLDAFGEEDIDMARGKPLYLNEERYAALTAMVVSHGLDHSSLVLSHTTRETVLWG